MATAKSNRNSAKAGTSTKTASTLIPNPYPLIPLIGFLVLLAATGWVIAIKAGRDLDTYWWHLQWVQRAVAAGQQERDLRGQLHDTLRELFQSFEHCRCQGDIEARNRLWHRFLDLLDAEERLAKETDRLFEAYQARLKEETP